MNRKEPQWFCEIDEHSACTGTWNRGERTCPCDCHAVENPPCRCQGIVHDPDCRCISPEARRAHDAAIPRLRELCAAAGHYPESDSDTGLGFGFLDLYCRNCQAVIRSIPVREAAGQDRAIIARLGLQAADAESADCPP